MPGNYSLALQNFAAIARHRPGRHSGRANTVDHFAARLMLMSCLASKQSLPNALQSRAVYRAASPLRASRTAVVVRALQKTRVVRGKCYVTKDASALSVQPLFLAVLLFARLQPESVLQNIDTDQIIPAEYLTLVPSKVFQLPFPSHFGSRSSVF